MSTEPNTNDSPDVIAEHLDQLRQVEMYGYSLSVRKARNALFWTAGLILFWEMLSMYVAIRDVYLPIVLFAVAVSGLFTALGFWTKKKPYTALVTGLICFIGYIALVAVVNGLVDGAAGVGKALVSGIIVKVIIFVNLIRPLKDAKALQEAMGQRF